MIPTLIAISWIATWCLGGFWLLCAVGNVASLVRIAFTGGSTSLIPFMGGVAGVIACLICPLPGSWRYAPLPFVLDIGSALTLVLLVVDRSKRRKHRGSPATRDASERSDGASIRRRDE